MSGFHDFIRKAKSGNLGLPEREIKNIQYDALRERCQEYIDHLTMVRVRICKFALGHMLTPVEFQSIMFKIDAIEDEFRCTELSTYSLNRAIYQSNIVLELLTATLSK